MVTQERAGLKQKIIGALVYPAAVITIAGGILAFILIYIIPKFETMFKEMDLGEGIQFPLGLGVAITGAAPANDATAVAAGDVQLAVDYI